MQGRWGGDLKDEEIEGGDKGRRSVESQRAASLNVNRIAQIGSRRGAARRAADEMACIGSWDCETDDENGDCLWSPVEEDSGRVNWDRMDGRRRREMALSERHCRGTVSQVLRSGEPGLVTGRSYTARSRDQLAPDF